MMVQLYLNILLIIGYVVISQILKAQQARKGFVIYSCLLLILHAGLRGLDVGADTEHYCNLFIREQYSSWSEIFGRIAEDRSLLFYPFMKAFHLLSNDYQIFLFVLASVFYISFFRMLYLNTSQTRDIFMAILIFQILFLYLPLSSLKQAVAMSIIFFAFETYKNRKYIKTIFLILFAAAFHPSAILFSLVFFIAKFKAPRALIVLSLLGSVILFTYGREFVTALSIAAGGENEYYMMQYANNTTRFAGAYSFMALMLIVSISNFFMYKRLVILNHYNLSYINFAAIALLLTPLAWVNPTLIRLFSYFSIYIVVLIPIIIKSIESKDTSKFIYFVSCVFFLIYNVFVKYEEYSFFWE